MKGERGTHDLVYEWGVASVKPSTDKPKGKSLMERIKERGLGNEYRVPDLDEDRPKARVTATKKMKRL